MRPCGAGKPMERTVVAHGRVHFRPLAQGLLMQILCTSGGMAYAWRIGSRTSC
jgi:hypothetical protein